MLTNGYVIIPSTLATLIHKYKKKSIQYTIKPENNCVYSFPSMIYILFAVIFSADFRFVLFSFIVVFILLNIFDSRTYSNT